MKRKPYISARSSRIEETPPKGCCWGDLIIPVVCALLIWGLMATGAKAKGIHNCEWPEHQTEQQALACNVYHESRDQSARGQIAVGMVTLNRVAASRFPDTVQGVVYQHRQFSWHSDGLSDRVYEPEAWEMSLRIAYYLLSLPEWFRRTVDYTSGSLFYHRDDVNPDWASGSYFQTEIGRHLFYLNDKKA